ncbi:MAG: hypothetical protein ACFFD4_34500 [Candidatus Odinarchaeota archaeon]
MVFIQLFPRDQQPFLVVHLLIDNLQQFETGNTCNNEIGSKKLGGNQSETVKSGMEQVDVFVH